MIVTRARALTLAISLLVVAALAAGGTVVARGVASRPLPQGRAPSRMTLDSATVASAQTADHVTSLAVRSERRQQAQ
ncbi:MAG TPA: hypothetical protein VOB72_15150, partial [Candidatus Dormibacteraeota bacterium]|nr:hypothetical protein [Candidatus Dormibacteraeota bacterium]